MARISLEQAAKWCGGKIEPKYADVTFYGATNDTRNLKPGQLFVALQGLRDGHEFIPQAFQNGAAAVLCSHCDGDYPAIVVEDTRKALGDIARGERLRLGMKVVGVTGSVGKSTTKEMIAAVLQTKYKVSKTPVNHNNDIGMPMSILAMPEDTEVAVLEMGMDHFREIAYLSSIAQPDIAVILNIGTMHIEHLGTQEGILRAKLEILEGMKPEGKLILNGDDQLLWNVCCQLDRKPEYFGIANTDCGVLGGQVSLLEDGVSFEVSYGQEKFPVQLAIEGEHFVLDALAAVSAGVQMGVSARQIQKALEDFQNMQGRQEIYEAKGFTIIDDCYNAGPESMAAALRVLGRKPGRHVAVLGDMLELGTRAQAEHYRIGRIAAENAEIILAYGSNSSRVISGAVTGGMSDSRAKAFENMDALVTTLKRLAKPGDCILVKGSHGMHMETALKLFLTDET